MVYGAGDAAVACTPIAQVPSRMECAIVAASFCERVIHCAAAGCGGLLPFLLLSSCLPANAVLDIQHARIDLWLVMLACAGDLMSNA